ncbi:MAG: hypothetical protein WC284_06380 [Candidimonas sp.]
MHLIGTLNDHLPVARVVFDVTVDVNDFRDHLYGAPAALASTKALMSKLSATSSVSVMALLIGCQFQIKASEAGKLAVQYLAMRVVGDILGRRDPNQRQSLMASLTAVPFRAIDGDHVAMAEIDMSVLASTPFVDYWRDAAMAC